MAGTLKIVETRKVEGPSDGELTVEWQLDTSTNDSLESIYQTWGLVNTLLDKWEEERFEANRTNKVRDGLEQIIFRARRDKLDKDDKTLFSDLLDFLPADERVKMMADLQEAEKLYQARNAQENRSYGRRGAVEI